MVTNNSKQIQIISFSSSKQRSSSISYTNYTYITYMYNHHILTIFAALTTGFSREIASLPAAL